MPIVRQIWTILAAFCLSAALIVALPTGCASGTNPLGSVLLPQTFNERLAAGYVLVSTLRETATALLTAGKLSADDGANVLQVTDVARAGLDVARTIAATSPDLAEAKLAATQAALVALQKYLATRSAQ